MCTHIYVQFGEGYYIVDWLKVVIIEYGRCIFLYVNAFSIYILN